VGPDLVSTSLQIGSISRILDLGVQRQQTVRSSTVKEVS
jgi:hypothetical protein